MNQALTECLKELRLPGVLAGYEHLAEVARRESFTYEKYLQEVVEGERELRHHDAVMFLRKSGIKFFRPPSPPHEGRRGTGEIFVVKREL
jgi:hypothetical protein